MASRKPDRPAQPTTQPPSERRRIPALVIWLVCAYLLLIPLTASILYSEGLRMVGAEITHDRAIFTAINALTLTGFQISNATSSYLPPGQDLLLGLTLIGSMLPLIVGGMAVVRIVRLPYRDGQVIASAAVACGLAMVIGAIPLIATGHPPRQAFMLAASAFGNSGLYFGSLPGTYSWQTHLVLLPLSVLGGLGLPVLMEMYDSLRRRRSLSVHGRTVLRMTAGLYLAFFSLFLLLHFVNDLVQWMDGAPLPTAADIPYMAGLSSTAALNSRSAGFAFGFVQDYPRLVIWGIALAMVIGASPAGTAGGIKCTTLLELFRGVRRALRGEAVGRIFGIAATWTGAYLLMTFLVFLLLLATVPQVAADRLLFESISALSNAGLSYEVIMIVKPGLDVLGGAMLLGRLAPLAILWWMALSTRDAEVAIG